MKRDRFSRTIPKSHQCPLTFALRDMLAKAGSVSKMAYRKPEATEAHCSSITKHVRPVYLPKPLNEQRRQRTMTGWNGQHAKLLP